MVHHIVLYKLKPEVTPARVEEMMMNTRMQLLKIPEVLSIKCGKRIDPELMLKDRKSTRLNSSHVSISYAVFCLKKKNTVKRHRNQVIHAHHLVYDKCLAVA